MICSLLGLPLEADENDYQIERHSDFLMEEILLLLFTSLMQLLTDKSVPSKSLNE